jgi:hypothetical protein
MGEPRIPQVWTSVKNQNDVRNRLSVVKNSFRDVKICWSRGPTNPWSRVHLEKLIVAQLVEKFLTVMFKRARYMSMSRARWIQSTPSHRIYLRIILILSSFVKAYWSTGHHHHHHQWHNSPESGLGLPYGFRDDIKMWVISPTIDLILVILIRPPETSSGEATVDI